MGINLNDLPGHLREQVRGQIKPRVTYEDKNRAGGVCDAEFKRDVGEESLAFDAAEVGGAGRVTLRITRFSPRTLDFDNGAGGCKALVDQLRYAKIIPDDCPEKIDFQFAQKKVKSRKEVRTEIELEFSSWSGWSG